MKGRSLLSILCIFAVHNIYSDDQHHAKWIVITTINYPTEAVKKFASLSDWRVVIVGDKKTPADWHLDNCIYLGPEQQEALGFQITKLLPWNHYSRKNIGYLYAIKHGASIIYDTDDDNIPMNNTLTSLPATRETLCYRTNQHVVNPYPHFGNKSIWPRGYPLESILKTPPAPYNTPYADSGIYNIYIQQGMVNLDPDVDAIFRLTQGTGTQIFDQCAEPICIPKETFSPFNSQNTFIHKQAFWGLLLPITPKFRVCDIWRGYWVQRLLWDIGGNICFTAPTVIQNRNQHNLMHDFIDEIDLYTKAGHLVKFLQGWNPLKKTLFERIIELTDDMVKYSFYQEKDSTLIRAWLQDLQDIGYQEPIIIE